MTPPDRFLLEGLNVWSREAGNVQYSAYSWLIGCLCHTVIPRQTQPSQDTHHVAKRRLDRLKGPVRLSSQVLAHCCR